jgi:hypothetical protein
MIALQFLAAGAEAGEIGINVSLTETEYEMRGGARSRGWEINDRVEIVQLLEPKGVLDPEHHQSLLYSLSPEGDNPTYRRCHRASEAEASGHRKLVGEPPARAELIALWSADSGPEVLIRPLQLDCRAAVRHDHEEHRSRRTQHCV